MHTSHSPTFSYPDQLEFETVYDEVFKQHAYYVDLDSPAPWIIDVGAHIGISALYFAKQYSRARILCIEPNPKTFDYLRKNIEQNDLTDRIEVIPKAVVGKDGTTTALLYTHARWGVFASLKPGGWTGEYDSIPISVETVKLSEVIGNQTIDLVKLDIEGMETEVLEEIRGKLTQVKHILLEFHATKMHSPERVSKILQQHYTHIEMTQDRRKERKKSDQLYLISATNTR